MDYSKEIWSVVSYIEKRIKEDIAYEELERITGFTYRHLREVFAEIAGCSLSRYINVRKSANAASLLVHSNKSLTEIAYEFGFKNYDTFTRVFKRETGMTPSEFRHTGRAVGRRRLGIGMFAPIIISVKENSRVHSLEIEKNETNKSGNRQDCCILYGVSKVHYAMEGWYCSPFPMCLKAVLNYMGQEINYSCLMAASGMAFRLRWNQNQWDPGNVGIQTIFEDPKEGIHRAFEAAGRGYDILSKQGNSLEEKEMFKALIRQHLDKGQPLISIGIIGPPEAGIITGYKNGGDTLLGWSLFQENMEFAGGVQFDECGYYITDHWWETVDCVITVGELLEAETDPKKILANGLSILKKELIAASYGEKFFYGGQAAYQAWAEAVKNDKEFSKDMILPLLLERFMCQGDAEVMVSEGRYCAADYLRRLGEEYPTAVNECEHAAKCFDDICSCINDMTALRKGHEQTEDTLMKFVDSDIRSQIAEYIGRAAACESVAAHALEAVIEKIN